MIEKNGIPFTRKLNHLIGRKIYSQLYLAVLFLCFPFLLFAILIVDAITFNLTGIFPISILLLTVGPFSLVSLLLLISGFLKAKRENNHANKQIAAFGSVFIIIGLVWGTVGLLFILAMVT